MEEADEEDADNALMHLEKKRQREIEVYTMKSWSITWICNCMGSCCHRLSYFSFQEWRAHQIASGEAKDNANFQPLSGDW